MTSNNFGSCPIISKPVLPEWQFGYLVELGAFVQCLISNLRIFLSRGHSGRERRLDPQGGCSQEFWAAKITLSASLTSLNPVFNAVVL